MKERVKVMQDMYENRSTNKKAAGCTVIISGEMKDVMDKIIAKHPEYKSYAQAFAGVVEHLGAAAWRVPGMSGTALLRKNTGLSRKRSTVRERRSSF